MQYALEKKVEISYDAVVEKVTGLLKDNGFGILTRIDVKNTLKEKLGVDFYRYEILGACNPNFAHEALQNQPDVGVLLPCNVVVSERENGVFVSIFNPKLISELSENSTLIELGEKVRKIMDGILKQL